MHQHLKWIFSATCLAVLPGCAPAEQTAHAAVAEIQPLAIDPKRFIENAEKDMEHSSEIAGRAKWIYANFITEDTAALVSEAGRIYTEKAVRYASDAAALDNSKLSTVEQRKLEMLKRAITLPSPADPSKSQRLANLGTELNGLYGKGRFCLSQDNCLSQPQLSSIMANSRDPEQLKQVWQGWREIAKPMRALFTEQVQLANEGALALGYNDVGELWRSKYDMPAQQFPQQLDALWEEVKPLYESLHCYVRGELNQNYGDNVVPPRSPIPAHLLGNMWAQQWGLSTLSLPLGADYDLTELLNANGYDEITMVQQAERFFTSMGFEPLQQTFWQRSLFVEPQDRHVVCHASAWDLDNKDDIRIKMCIRKNGEDFNVIHHELGHNIYQRAYKDQPFLFKGSANDGFHEAIGDVISLSLGPNYL